MLLLLLVGRRRWLAQLGCAMIDGVDVAMIVGLLWVGGERRRWLATTDEFKPGGVSDLSGDGKVSCLAPLFSQVCYDLPA